MQCDDDVGGCDTLHPPNNASEESVAPLPSSNTSIVMNAGLADIHVYDDGNFEEVYARNIATPLTIVEDQFRQLVWNDNPMEVSASTSDGQRGMTLVALVVDVLVVFCRTSRRSWFVVLIVINYVVDANVVIFLRVADETCARDVAKD
jgi:hypothetical protein